MKELCITSVIIFIADSTNCVMNHSSTCVATNHRGFVEKKKANAESRHFSTHCTMHLQPTPMDCSPSILPAMQIDAHQNLCIQPQSVTPFYVLFLYYHRHRTSYAHPFWSRGPLEEQPNKKHIPIAFVQFSLSASSNKSARLKKCSGEWPLSSLWAISCWFFWH